MNTQATVRSEKRIDSISIVPLRELHPKRFQRAMAKRKNHGFVDRIPAKPEASAEFLLRWQRLASATYSVATLVDLIFILANSTAKTEVKITTPCRLTTTPFDIRIYLSDRRIVSGFFRQLAPFQTKAIGECVARGAQKTAALLKRIDLNKSVPDFCLWNRCGIEIEMSSVEFSQEFVEFALPFVSGKSESIDEIQGLAATMKQVAEGSAPDLKIPLALHILAHSRPATAISWISVLMGLKREEAQLFVRLLFENNAQDFFAELSFLEKAFEDIRRNSEWNTSRCPLEVQTKGWRAIFRALKANVNEDLIYWGLRMWRLTKELPRLHEFRGQFPERTMNHWLDWIQDTFGSSGFALAGDLFNELGQTPELKNYLDLIPADLPPSKKRGLLCFLTREVNCLESMQKIGTKRFERLCDFHRTTAPSELSSGYFEIATLEFQSMDAFEGALAISARYLKFGSEMTNDDDEFWGSFLTAHDVAGKPVAEKIRALPDITFKRLATAFRSDIQASKIQRGHKKFAERFIDDSAYFLQHHPARYFAVMAKLGDASLVTIESVDSYACHPLCDEPVWEKDFHSLKILTDAVVFHHGLRNPFSKRLRAHLNGERVLEPKILKRERQVLKNEILALRLEILRLEIDRLVQKQEQSDVQSHTIILAKDISDNRRILRRFINEASNGSDVKAWLNNHPRNQYWLNEMSKTGLQIENWLEGTTTSAEIPNLGNISLSKEEDPEEVLKMGTYVGSCLSVGQFNAFSTVANMCDVNKQVIYARNKRGKVVGRQLVAISKELELVCFRIYNNTDSGQLTDQFLEFDRDLARKVGLPLFDSKKRRYNDYEIDRLVCQSWYDDGSIEI